jgi:hypothetical protein
MTIIWFIVWFVADHIGDRESLLFDPPNAWTATLLLAIALDINRPQVMPRRSKQAARPEHRPDDR